MARNTKKISYRKLGEAVSLDVTRTVSLVDSNSMQFLSKHLKTEINMRTNPIKKIKKKINPALKNLYMTRIISQKTRRKRTGNTGFLFLSEDKSTCSHEIKIPIV
ncbi:MAG: hypothetical protein WBL21_14090 [Salinimicrobium sp.]